jgi:predicted pyridoxine 5'-phosphate oxidase superfamily flavin-nucleotide-binding protein
MQGFGDLMFRGAVAEAQRARGSHETYARMAARPGPDALGEAETAFIQSRDSAYLASVSETGWPHVQHRGGPPGFLRVTGPQNIAFADCRGNRQFVTTGHVAANDRVALFLMDYPRKARLKILARARIAETGDEPDLARAVSLPGAPPAERVVVMTVAAFDWNCPKYITPRFTEAELAAALAPRLAAYDRRIRDLEAQVRALGGTLDGDIP